jgi:hypothetical protein
MLTALPPIAAESSQKGIQKRAKHAGNLPLSNAESVAYGEIRNKTPHPPCLPEIARLATALKRGLER